MAGRQKKQKVSFSETGISIDMALSALDCLINEGDSSLLDAHRIRLMDCKASLAEIKMSWIGGFQLNLWDSRNGRHNQGGY